jgi:hypothetical protein
MGILPAENLAFRKYQFTRFTAQKAQPAIETEHTMTGVLENLEVLQGGSFALGAPTYINHYALAANTAKNIAIPANASVAIFSANADFYANYTGTAVVPAGDVTDGTGSEMNPTVRYVKRITSPFSVIAPATTVLTIAWYVN